MRGGSLVIVGGVRMRFLYRGGGCAFLCACGFCLYSKVLYAVFYVAIFLFSCAAALDS